MIGRTRLGDEFWHFSQLSDLLVREFRRADKGDDDICFGVVLHGANEAAARESGAQSVLSLVLRIQLMLFDLIITELLKGTPECLELRLEFRLPTDGNGDEDQAAFGPNQLNGLLSHHFAHAAVEAN